MTMQDNDTRDMLADSIGRLFSEQITPELIREVEEGHWPAELWQLLQEQGFDLALVPEEAGGLGLSWDTVYPVLFACGRHTLPLPLPEVMLGNWLLGKAGIELPEGRVTLAQLPAEAVQAAGGGSVQVHGTLRDVPWASGAGHLVVCATLSGQEHVGLLPLSTAALEGELNIAREPRHTVHFDAPVTVRMVPVPGLAPQAVTLYGAMLRSAQMAGAAEKLLAQTIQYAGERVQFGRALAKFQVIQQHIAVIGSEAAAMAAAADYAFDSADTPSAELAVMAAKIRTGVSAGKVASLAHAVHGAIGFTYEHSLHYASRRLWAWRSEFGSHAWWSERLGRQTAAVGKQGWWPMVTAGTAAG